MSSFYRFVLVLLSFLGQRRNACRPHSVGLVRFAWLLFLLPTIFPDCILALRPSAQLIQLHGQHMLHSLQKLNESILGKLQMHAQVVGLRPEIPNSLVHLLYAKVCGLEIALLHLRFDFAQEVTGQCGELWQTGGDFVIVGVVFGFVFDLHSVKGLESADIDLRGIVPLT